MKKVLNVMGCAFGLVTAFSSAGADEIKSLANGNVFRVEVKGNSQGIAEEMFNLIYEDSIEHSPDSATDAKSDDGRMIGVSVKNETFTATALTGDLIRGTRTYTVSFDIDGRTALQCKDEVVSSYHCFSFTGHAADELTKLVRNSENVRFITCSPTKGKNRCILKYRYESPSYSTSGSSWD